MTWDRTSMISTLLIGFVVFLTSCEVQYFWHFTDPHLDLQYVPGTDADCGKILHTFARQCCRSNDTKSSSGVKAGYFGTPYHKCDLPHWTYDLILEQMSQIVPNPTAILSTGDTPGHDFLDQTMDLNVAYFDEMTARLNVRFPDSPSFICLGNHDAWPTNFLAHSPFSDWLLVPLSETMLKYGWATLGEAADFATDGYFSHTFPNTPLRLINLETQWMSTMNVLNRGWEDEANQAMVTWFKSELESARSKKERVLLLAHIPPYAGENAFPEWNVAFISLLQEYSDVMWLTLFGHTHNDRFGLIRSPDGNGVSSYYIVGGALTSYSEQFPTVKLISYDDQTLELFDIVTYFVNLTKSNANGILQLEKEYSTKEFYSLTEFSANEFKKVYDRLLNDSSFMDEFTRFYFGSSEGWKDCDEWCRRGIVCDVGQLNQSLHSACRAKK